MTRTSKNQGMRNGRRHAALDARDDAVTPVIGSIIILGITVLGITGVVVWGAPALQELQERGAQAAMLGEFREVRRDTLILSITDSSRVPRLTIDQGTLALEAGTRYQITSNHHPTQTDCDMHVKDWGVGANNDRITVSFTNCGASINIDDVGSCGDPCFRVYQVSGPNTFEQTITATTVPSPLGSAVDSDVEVGGVDFTQGNWMFELGNAAGTDSYAQAWLMDSDALEWELIGGTERRLWFEMGAVFTETAGTIYLEEEPALAEQAFGTDDFVIRVPVLSGTATAESGPATPSLFLQLTGNHLRVSETDTTLVRFDWEGGQAQAWCNTIMLRQSDLDRNAAWAEAAGYTCDGGQDRKSLEYTSQTSLNGVGDPPFCGTDCFGFEFIHATINTVL